MDILVFICVHMQWAGGIKAIGKICICVYDTYIYAYVSCTGIYMYTYAVGRRHQSYWKDMCLYDTCICVYVSCTGIYMYTYAVGRRYQSYWKDRSDNLNSYYRVSCLLRLCVYMCVCIYIYICVCMYVCM